MGKYIIEDTERDRNELTPEKKKKKKKHTKTWIM